MQTADFNHQDFNTSREQEVDEQLLVRFFHKERENKAATIKEGRPIFKEVEYVEIRIPGSRSVQACRPATEGDKQRFHRHYEAFKKRVELPEEGTLLAEWPQISRSQVEELKFFGVKTVENMANMSDTNATQFQGGYALRTRAKEWLEKADSSALIAQKEAMEARIAELEADIKLLRENALETDPEPGASTNPAPPTVARRRRKKAE